MHENSFLGPNVKLIHMIRATGEKKNGRIFLAKFVGFSTISMTKEISKFSKKKKFFLKVSEKNFDSITFAQISEKCMFISMRIYFRLQT